MANGAKQLPWWVLLLPSRHDRNKWTPCSARLAHLRKLISDAPKISVESFRTGVTPVTAIRAVPIDHIGSLLRFTTLETHEDHGSYRVQRERNLLTERQMRDAERSFPIVISPKADRTDLASFAACGEFSEYNALLLTAGNPA